MLPQAEAPGAIPLVLYAQVTGLAVRHSVTLISLAEPHERLAAQALRACGIQIHTIERGEPHGLARWERRWRFARTWLRGQQPFRTIWFWDKRVQQTIDELLARNPYDIVIAEDNATGIYRFETRAPRVLTEHEVRRPRSIDWQSIAGEKSWRVLLRELDWQHWRNYHLAVWRRFDGIQAFTARDAAAIQTLAPEVAARVRVNPFGVALPAIDNLSREDANEIIFIGNMTHPPNVDAAVWLGREIMPELIKLIPSAHLTIVGDSPPAEVRALANDNIAIAGYVPTIAPYLERAAVIVAPIRIGGGQRMKVLQGLAYGKAVVTTPRGADGLDIEGCAPPLSIATDTASLAQAIAELLASATARHNLGQRARAFVEQHYSPAAYARRLEKIYGELIRK
jgi:glycosyltransferase involved in cell wall biosynthesis